MIRNAFIRLVDGRNNNEMCIYNLTENYSGQTAMLFGEVYRYNNEWKFSAVQFKYLDGKPYFLEVNTRMSGGVQMACLASTVNIPSIAVNKILGVDKPWTIQKKDCFITHVEAPIVLETHL